MTALVEKVEDAIWQVGSDEPDYRAGIAAVFDWLEMDDTKSRDCTRWLAEMRKAALTKDA